MQNQQPQHGPDLYNGDSNLIASNDDYYGTDSYPEPTLSPGTYYVGVSASGNTQYNPNISGQRSGGTIEGPTSCG